MKSKIVTRMNKIDLAYKDMEQSLLIEKMEHN